eukprot:82539-Rhodomonas_salina.5
MRSQPKPMLPFVAHSCLIQRDSSPLVLPPTLLSKNECRSRGVRSLFVPFISTVFAIPVRTHETYCPILLSSHSPSQMRVRPKSVRNGDLHCLLSESYWDLLPSTSATSSSASSPPLPWAFASLTLQLTES